MVDLNPHIQYGRSDRRGFILMAVTQSAVNTSFMGLDDVHDAASGIATLARFGVTAGSARVTPG